MLSKRKKYVIDKGFQYKLSFKITAFPLITLIIISTVLIYFAVKNNSYINDVVKTQDSMIEMFLQTPALNNSENPAIKNGEKTFKENIGKLMSIKKNSKAALYFIAAMTVIQSIIIFALIIFISHKISGPIFVITRYMKEINQGKIPHIRPLRKNDEFQEFYAEFSKTAQYLSKVMKNLK